MLSPSSRPYAVCLGVFDCKNRWHKCYHHQVGPMLFAWVCSIVRTGGIVIAIKGFI